MFRSAFFRFFPQKSQRFFTRHFSSIQIIVAYYILTTLIAFGLLSLPIFHLPDAKVHPFDMLFMAISTISVTGLSTFNINEVFNHEGIILLEVLFQVGGLGIMMITTFFFIIAHRKISLRQRQLIMTDMNQPKLSGIVRLIRTTFAILLVLQMLFGLIFSIHFYIRKIHPDWTDAAFYGFYQSISAVTNSGFDVTGASIMPYGHDVFFLIMIMLLITIGGIGFPVLLEIKEWAFHKRAPRSLPFRFSLFSKLAVTAFLIFFVGGTIVIYLLERKHLFAALPESQKWLNAAFYSVTTRNAGLQLHPLNDFQPATLLFFSILMFIGCSPSSVGGGVRTTTVIILGLYLLSFIRSSENVNIFHRRIGKEDLKKAIVVFNLSLFMCLFAIIVLAAIEDHSLISLVLEVSSAFGTTGLSLGITPDLTFVGKIIIALLMFIGRIGMLYMLMIFVPKETRDRGYLYPTEQIIIG